MVFHPHDIEARRSATGSSLARRARWCALPFVVVGILVVNPGAAGAYPNPGTVELGVAAQFSVLAGSTVTNSGATTVSGDADSGNLGVSPGTAVTGFTGPPNGVVLPPGAIHAGDALASQAQTAAGSAAVSGAGRVPNETFGPVHDLASQTFNAGVYAAPTSLAVGGVGGSVTLDGQNNPDAVFIFQIGSTLITGASSAVMLVNGAQACNVFWIVGSSATLGANSTFSGTILASASVSVSDGVDVQGRLLAGTGAVTLLNDTIHAPGCAPSSGVPSAPLLGRATWPVTGAAFLLAAAVLVYRRRQRRPTFIL